MQPRCECLRAGPTSVSLAWYSARLASMALKALRKLSASTRSADTFSAAPSAAERDRASSACTSTQTTYHALDSANTSRRQAIPSSKVVCTQVDLPGIDCELHIRCPGSLSTHDCLSELTCRVCTDLLDACTAASSRCNAACDAAAASAAAAAAATRAFSEASCAVSSCSRNEQTTRAAVLRW
jgi:hypothetical protein